MLEDKVHIAMRLIKKAVGAHRHPVMAWSGGKDSMVMLDIVSRMHMQMPVVQCIEPWQPKKYRYQNEMIDMYNLEVYTIHPFKSTFQQEGSEFEVQNYYRINDFVFTCPSGITPREDGLPFKCSLDMYKRPKSPGITANWDLMLIGHKGCDSDPILGGDAGTRIDIRVNPNPGQLSLAFPLQAWSHDDVFQYLEEYDVPMDYNRYVKTDDKWQEDSDREYNCDYVHACTACIDRETTEKFVFCPKYDGVIENVSSMVEWDSQEKLSYMRD